MPKPTSLPDSDATFCAKICRIATEQGWQLDDMCNSISGCSFAFEHPDGRRVAGGITATKRGALLSACKAFLPQIYQHL